ncbi:UDP-N-acetyl-alpha-D-muramoyl-L-alanyl-L-glutamate epimerase [soil metagenome]
MSTPSAVPVQVAPPVYRARQFLYEGFEIDTAGERVLCRYRLDDHPFTEVVSVPGVGSSWDAPAVEEAARLVFLLAGISYYKAGAPPIVDLGSTAIREPEREFLTSYYHSGLGEYSYRNRLQLGISFTGGRAAAPKPDYRGRAGHPLIPFGGGLDSIVTVERIRSLAESPSLFIVSSGGRNFASIDDAAGASGLPVVRATRDLDPSILRPLPNWLNGHVPVTGIISSIAVLAAVLGGNDSVVMSNEWSTSAGNTLFNGEVVNHQYSKSAAFEDGFRRVLDGAFSDPPDYFSLLRSSSTLWIARHFARLDRYHPVFRSCNRAFHIDLARRQLDWCGVCDKCCFVDLVLAPFLSRDELNEIFKGREPLENPELDARFATLLGLTDQSKPFECVGDVDECRIALSLAASRSSRAGNPVLAGLGKRLAQAGVLPDPVSADAMFRPLSPNNVPERYAAAADLD